MNTLRGNERIVKLIDSEISESVILMVMEYGETDLAQMLQKRQGEKLNINFIKICWEQVRIVVTYKHFLEM